MQDEWVTRENLQPSWRLVGENVLEVTQNGLRFYSLSLDDLAEVYYMRAILEGSAARLAAAYGGVALARRLREILEEARPLLATDGHDEFARLNGEFHGAIKKASGNRRIQEALSSLNGMSRRRRPKASPPRPLSRTCHGPYLGWRPRPDSAGSGGSEGGSVLAGATGRCEGQTSSPITRWASGASCP